MKRLSFRILCLMMVFALVLPCSAFAKKKEDKTHYYEEALAALKTPAEEGMETGTYTLRTSDSAYVPCVAPAITPSDELEGELQPLYKGTFASSDESVVTVSELGKMTGVQPGMAEVSCTLEDGSSYSFTVTVSDDAMPEGIKNYLYVVNREYYSVQRAKLGKTNKYTKWLYKSKKAVGWCSVFTIYCANASGNNPIDLNDADLENPPSVLFFHEGQVGHQYDGFLGSNRFVGVPKPGYLLIYTRSTNGYRYEHIATVVDVQDRGDGVYALTTVEGNMNGTVMRYSFLYDSKKDNHEPGTKSQKNMSVLPEEEWTDPITDYKFTTYRGKLAVTGFCATWE